MAGKLKGIKQAHSKFNILVKDICEKKSLRAINSALLVGGAQAAFYTPVDTSTLLNSQFREVKVEGNKILGKVGYTAKYAAAVHSFSGKLKGQPRADFGTTSNRSDFGPKKPTSFGGGTKTGRYWDPHGEPQFLKKGFEDSRSDIDRVVIAEMKL